MKGRRSQLSVQADRVAGPDHNFAFPILKAAFRYKDLKRSWIDLQQGWRVANKFPIKLNIGTERSGDVERGLSRRRDCGLRSY